MAVEDEFPQRNRNKSWWKQRTKMERILIVTVLLSLLLIIGLVVGAAVAAARHGKTLPCLTEVCVSEAAHLLKRMNTALDPCDDFYKFACGSYTNETEIPADKTEVDPLDIIGDVLNEQVKKVITEESKSGEIRPFTLLRKFYAACINTSAIEENGLEQMKTTFQSLGGWPILEKDNWVESSWIEVTHKLRQNGFDTSHFIAVEANINQKNSSEYIISVDQAVNEEVADDNLKGGLKDSIVKVYADYLIDLAVLFGVDRQFATNEVNAVIEYRAKIAEISLSKTEHQRIALAANETTISALQIDYQTIDWLYLINGALAIPNKTVSSNDKVLVSTPKYVSQFEQIISNTPKRVQANHALLQVLRASVDFLPKSFRDRNQQFNADVFGASQARPRWDTCITKATNSFNLAADALYVRRYVDEEVRTDVTEMVSNIKKAFTKIVGNVQWMDSATKQVAITKAENVIPYIAYPVELRDDKELEDYYSQLKFDSENILALISEVAKLKKDKEVGFYGRPAVRSHWTTRTAAITSNALYDPQSNSIQIPSGIMQKEFYNKNRPKYMNYGGLGLVIGHELTHGFDNVGKQFDKDGNTVNWWNTFTDEAYSLRAQCFIEQYGNYTVPEIKMNLNGENTLGENIADNGGIKEAYLAYLEWVERNKEENPLPGINYSPKQLFWISLANAWCTKSRPSAIESAVLTDEHSPNPYRILGSFSNNEYFAKDFNCPIGSKMNPGKKCQIW